MSAEGAGGIIARPLLIIFERSWLIRRGTRGLEESKCNYSLQKQQEGGHREVHASQSYLGPWRRDRILEAISKHVEDKKVIKSSQHRFTKGKSCLTNLIAMVE